MLSEPKLSSGAERLSAELQEQDGARQVKIRVESFDERLGWYSSGTLVLGVEQLPMLEQAIAEMRAVERARQAHVCEIIPFPGMASADSDDSAQEGPDLTAAG